MAVPSISNPENSLGAVGTATSNFNSERDDAFVGRSAVKQSYVSLGLYSGFGPAAGTKTYLDSATWARAQLPIAGFLWTKPYVVGVGVDLGVAPGILYGQTSRAGSVTGLSLGLYSAACLRLLVGPAVRACATAAYDVAAVQPVGSSTDKAIKGVAQPAAGLSIAGSL